MKLDSVTIKQLQFEITDALKALGDKHGVEFAIDGGSYDRMGRYATLKLQVNVLDSEGVAQDPARLELELYGESLGLPADSYGQEFTVRGRTFKIVGLRTRAPKRPVIAECDGKQYVLSTADVLAGMKRVAA